MAEINDWSVNAASNSDPSPDGAPEGMNPSGVNDTIRENMAVLSRWQKDTNGSVVSGGSGGAYTVAANQTLSAYYDGLEIWFDANHANTGAATLNVDGVGAAAVVTNASRPLGGGEIQAGQKVGVIYDGANWQLISLAVPASLGLPRLYKSGLEIQPDSSDFNNNIAIAAGVCRSRDDTQDIVLTSRIKSINGAYVTGAAGGLFSGTKAANTWYHCFAIRRDSDGLCDAGFSTDINASDRPAGFGTYRRIGSFYTDGSTNIVRFQQNKNFFTAVQSTIFNASSFVGQTVVGCVTPPGVSVKILIQGFMNLVSGGDASLRVYNPSSNIPITIARRNTIGQVDIGNLELFTTNSSTIVADVTGTGTVASAQIYQLGYTDFFDE